MTRASGSLTENRPKGGACVEGTRGQACKSPSKAPVQSSNKYVASPLQQGDEMFDSMEDSAIGSLEGDEDPGEKKTLKERLQSVQEITALVQNVLGEIASFGERVKK